MTDPIFDDLLLGLDLTDLRRAGVGLAMTSLIPQIPSLEEKLPPLPNSVAASLGAILLQQVLDVSHLNGHEWGCLPMAVRSLSHYLKAGETAEKIMPQQALDPRVDWRQALSVPFNLRRVGTYIDWGNSSSSLALLSGMSAVISR